MDEEILDNLQAVDDDNEISNFPQFQQKQIGEFIKKILGDNITAQKAFRDKFNRCLSLFVFYLSHIVVQAQFLILLQIQMLFSQKMNFQKQILNQFTNYLVTVMKEDNRKKKNEKKKVQVTKDDIIMTLKLIDFQEIAETLENFQQIQSSQENVIQQENQLEQELKDDEMREIQNFENIEDEQKDEENNDNNEQIQDNQNQDNEEIDDENNEDIENNQNEQQNSQ